MAWIRDYERAWLRPDLVAGLTAAAVVIPKAMAYATIAGLPVQVGLYTAFLPMVIYALLGSSRPLSVSTTTTIAILTASALAEVARAGDSPSLVAAAATLTLLVGASLVLAAVLRLGFVANFISEPVLTGFKAGIGIVIVVDQVPKLLGLHFDKGPFLHHVLAIVRSVPDASSATVVVATLTIALLVGIERFAPRLSAPLIAVAAGILASTGFDLAARGVATVGDVPTGLPSLTLPELGLIGSLWPAALGIALMSFTETIAAGRAFAERGEPRVEPNRELVATGLANAGGAFLGSMPAGGGTSQTAVNRRAGARTQASSLFSAAAALVTMLLFAPLLGRMPEATLGAVVIVYSFGLIQPAEFRTILDVRRMEFLWALSALAGVVLLGTLQGILVAIVVSLLGLAQQVADPPVHVLGRKPGSNVFRPRSSEHPEDEIFPGLLLLRPEGRIFFANVSRVGEKIRRAMLEAKPKVVALHLRGVFDLEYTALKMLTEAEQSLRADGVRLWLVGLNPGVLAMVQRSPLGDALGREGLLFNLEQAVAKYQALPSSR
jgi:high affinity sulfate transporter 1